MYLLFACHLVSHEVGLYPGSVFTDHSCCVAKKTKKTPILQQTF